jgi:DNA primase
MKAGMDVKLAVFPEGKDPADLVREDKELWRTGIREAKHVIDFVLERIMKTEADTRKAKQRVTREVLPYVAMIGSPIDQAHFISQIARTIGVEESVVRDELRRAPTTVGDQTPAATPAAKAESTKHDRLVKLLAGILFWQEKETKPAIDPKSLRDSFSRILDTAPEALFPEADRDGMAFEAEVGYQDSAHIDGHIAEMLMFLEEHMLKDELARYMGELARLEGEGNQAASLELLAKCKDITKRLNTLQNPV